MDKIIFQEVDSLNCLSGLRNHYLDNLIEPQELYLELKIKSSKFYIIKSGDIQIGYFLLDSDNTLWEYYIIHDYINNNDDILGKAIEKFSISKALCKSFDHDYLSCCVKYQKAVKIIGIHFREYNRKQIEPNDKDIIIRFPVMEDEKTIIDINEEVFESNDEVSDYIVNKKMFIFEKDKEILGFGIFSRVIKDRPDFDIGMLVTKKYRRLGYGSLIISYLADYCLRNNWRPICGCAIENEASRRCLEKAGFTAGYRLLEFTL